MIKSVFWSPPNRGAIQKSRSCSPVFKKYLFRSTIYTAIVLTMTISLSAFFIFPVHAEKPPLLQLTAEERSWLKQHSGDLPLLFNTAFPPMEFVSKTGDFTGIGADVFALIEKQLEVTFPKIPSFDWNKHLAALKSGECAFAPTIVSTPEREQYIYFTTPYATVPVVIIGPRDSGRGLTLDYLSEKKVAVVSGFATEQYLRDRSDGRFTIVTVESVSEGLWAVSFGRVDAYVENLAVAAYYIDTESIPNLQVIGNTDYSFVFRIGISRKYPLLYSAVQKALNTIPEEKLDSVRKHYISLQVQSGMEPKTIRMLKLIGVFTVLLMLGLAFISYFLKRKLKEKIEALQASRQTLLDQTELLQLAMEATQAALWDCKPGDETVYLSRQWYVMLGYAPREKNTHLNELRGFIHPEDLPKVDRIFETYIKSSGQDRFEAEFRLLRSDGSWCWILSKARAVAWDKEGKPIRIIGLDINIQNIKETQTRMALSEAKFRAIFDYAPYAISMNSLNGGFLDANPALLKNRNISKEKILNHKIPDFVQMSKAETREIINALRKTGSIANLETTIKNPDGTFDYALCSSALVEIEGEKRILSMLVDITELKQAERAIKENEERFRRLFKLAPIPLLEVSLEGVMLAFNNRFHETLGYTLDDIPTLEHWWQKVYPDPNYRNWVISTWNTAVEQAKKNNIDIHAGDFRVTCKDGTVRTMIIRSGGIGQSQIVCFLDITKRKQEEVARMESLELLRATLNTTPDGILVVNNELKVTQANQQFYKMWEVPKERRKIHDNTTLPDFIGDQVADPVGFRNMMDNLYRRRTRNVCEISLKNGRIFECYSAPMIMAGKKFGRVLDFRDISEYKWAEMEREKLQEQLLQAQKMEAVGTLAGGVAHDFNNMLGAIMGYTEITMDRMDANDPFRNNLAKILDAAQRSVGLTRQLLTFARKQTVTPIVFDLSASVESTLKILRRLIGENIELVWQSGETSCLVKIDPTQLDQILANLCVNARDAISDVGKVTIKVETAVFDDVTCKCHADCIPGDYVCLMVSDNGCGMDPETCKHIFEPFFTTKGMREGTGLGLSTVYGIVKQNKGFIILHSKPGTGTVFNIFLPKYTEGDAAELSEPENTIPRSRGETILMVEDDPTLLEMGRMMLQRLGYEVLPVASPGEAIRLIEENACDVHMFITDVIMPEMNGRDLADRLLSVRPGLKHLFMSGYTAEIITHQGIRNDKGNFIQKPFSFKDIAVKIRTALDT